MMSNIPKHLKFTATHEWLNGSDEPVLVGITDHAQQLLGDMVFVDLPDVGLSVKAGDELGVLESVKAASDFYAPISGVIVEVNQQVNADPALVNTSPYGAGWLVKIKASDVDEVSKLLSADQYQHEIAGAH